jgi:hypothetical protein
VRRQTPAPKCTALGVHFYGERGHHHYQLLLQLTRDEAQRIAANIAKLSDLLESLTKPDTYGQQSGCKLCRSTAVEKHELSKIDFELIDDALSAQYVSGCLHRLARNL